jgi:hypothetical protein
MSGMEHVARMLEIRNVNKILIGKPEMKRPLGEPKIRWEVNFKVHVKETG